MSASMPLSSRVPELGSLDLLVTLARVGTLGRAAEVHGVTQQAVGSRIRRTEHLLGMALIERSVQGSRLTSEGVLVVEWAQGVIEAARAFGHGVEALRAERNGHLAVVASRTVGEYLMPRWLVQSHRDDPSVEVTLEVCSGRRACQQVLDGSAELGFVESPDLPPGLRSVCICRDQLSVVVGRTHAWARRRNSITPDELSRTPLIQGEQGSGTRDALRHAMIRGGVGSPSAPPFLELRSTSAIKSAVADGRAPAVLSSLAVATELREGTLIEVPAPGLDLTRSLQAIWTGGTSLLGPARTFVALATRVEATRLASRRRLGR